MNFGQILLTFSNNSVHKVLVNHTCSFIRKSNHHRKHVWHSVWHWDALRLVQRVSCSKNTHTHTQTQFQSYVADKHIQQIKITHCTLLVSCLSCKCLVLKYGWGRMNLSLCKSVSLSLSPYTLSHAFVSYEKLVKPVCVLANRFYFSRMWAHSGNHNITRLLRSVPVCSYCVMRHNLLDVISYVLCLKYANR